MIEDRRVMMDEPFRSVGSIGQIFENDMDIAMKIMTVIDQIKQNAEVTVERRDQHGKNCRNWTSGF